MNTGNKMTEIIAGKNKITWSRMNGVVEEVRYDPLSPLSAKSKFKRTVLHRT